MRGGTGTSVGAEKGAEGKRIKQGKWTGMSGSEVFFFLAFFSLFSLTFFSPFPTLHRELKLSSPPPTLSLDLPPTTTPSSMVAGLFLVTFVYLYQQWYSIVVEG